MSRYRDPIRRRKIPIDDALGDEDELRKHASEWRSTWARQVASK